ncbi:hypothetical protein BD770DRAFT_405552 [Pilaira anomala]|nr:hypothetical protein BD770DRAFT_405552 [Pilaira anomala]
MVTEDEMQEAITLEAHFREFTFEKILKKKNDVLQLDDKETIKLEYAFNVMHFTENRQLQPILASLLEEEMGTSNETQNVKPYTLAVPELSDQLLQPAIIYQQPIYNKSFRFGDIRQGCQKILNVLRYGNHNIHNTITQ